MKITMYELLGLVKDGKAPNIIKYKGTLYEYDSNDEFYFNNGWSLYREFPENGNCLNDEVEILEEKEKKIPERLNKNYYITQPDINQPSKISYNMEQLLEMVQDVYEKQGEICDYLKSKGE